MRTFKKLSFIFLALFAFQANAQTDKATTTKIVEEKNYTFVATKAIPLNNVDINNILSRMPGNTGGGIINLSGSTYDVRITPDSVIAYLPYYGRAYNATLNGDDSGFKFATKNFTYTSKKRKKGGWEVVINTKDTKENPRLSLSISENGYGSLVITSNNKQSITYNGYIAENGKKN
ncbi:DUF4251 domain-containing protein [Pedobacter sp. Hv1]|uniref:DUF4251 domain-containing protein n=1 Tax=Pedobacter sp. Hv1 TaxID=1740090 RepID=UPI0006D8BFBA|nr:DUF4251 domain-containing protein [Pedobacter sp. Hv1]KQB99511.1 hypothetical protein AQF98_18295 [Pedobacter sp. Hv1]